MATNGSTRTQATRFGPSLGIDSIPYQESIQRRIDSVRTFEATATATRTPPGC
jgi:hypothetical protein